MYKLDRRTFLELLGQGIAVLGMGLSGTAGAQTGNVIRRNIKYQPFQPGEYFDWEKNEIEELFAIAEKGPDQGREQRLELKEEDIILRNRLFDPYNPLFNDREYARKAGYPGVPLRPSEVIINPPWPGAMDLSPPDDIGDTWAYGNDGSDFEYFGPPVCAGTYVKEDTSLYFEEWTPSGGDIRVFRHGGFGDTRNEKGELVLRATGACREGYKKIIDGSPPPTYTEKMTKWVKDMPLPHYTTDEEWEYIKELWDKEYMRSSQKLYWEDVNIGDEPAWTCSGPISQTTLQGMTTGGGRTTIMTIREYLAKTDPKKLFRDMYGIYGAPSRHTNGMNILGARATFVNDYAVQNAVRMVTNYIGDAGAITRVRWYMRQAFSDLWGQGVGENVGDECLDKVPYMKGKASARAMHGYETDTIIAKGYVTDKYINDKGEHIIDLSTWLENFDDAILEVVAFSAKLPSRRG